MPADAAYLASLRILRHRFNSEAELRQKLRARDFEKEVIEATIVRLREERWLDDGRFAGAFVRTRARRGAGRARIRRELAAAGVADEEAKQAIAENLDEESERSALAAAAGKRIRLLIRRHGEGYLATDEGRNKLTAYLLKQGYDSALVQSVMKELTLAQHQ